MFFLKKCYLPLLPVILIFFAGCSNKNVTSSPKSSKCKVKNNEKNRTTKASRHTKLSGVSTTAKSSIIYNYSPKDTLEDQLDDNYLYNLALSGEQSHQLKYLNGTQLPEQISKNFEQLALSWEENSNEVDEAFKLWETETPYNHEQKNLKSVHFDFGCSTLNLTENNAIQDIFNTVQQAIQRGHKLIIKGYSDPTENPSQTLTLSFERAKAVKDYLVDLGIDQNLIEVIAADSTDLAMLQKNSQSSDENETQQHLTNSKAEIIIS